MKIELRQISVRELTEKYVDNNENGVWAYNGKLNVRPPYQREFVYGEKERDAVIDTLTNGFPLNVMYWADNGDGTYEIIDGQQRTISICQYVTGNFSFDLRFFHNLQDSEKNKIYDYKLQVYFCSGTDVEKLKWFKTINIAGKELTDQELRNAVYSGPWVTDAKRYFSKTGCPAAGMASDYLNGSAIRQEYLETAIKWISKGDIVGYMGKHQHDKNAAALWQYFNSVISWVESTFKPTKEQKKIMKGLDWGYLYDKYKDEIFDLEEVNNEVASLLMDDDVTNKKGIYPYIITKDESKLNIREFSPAQKLAVYTKQGGICPHCGKHFDINSMEGDHIIPWSKGGKTITENCQMLCKNCNLKKGGQYSMALTD